MNKVKRRGMPSKDEILCYWKKRIRVAEKECFACGSPYELNRAHLKPLWVGGTNALKNFHLLCAICHDESEGVKPYNKWFKWQRKHAWKDSYDHAWDRLKKFGITNEVILKHGKKYDYDLQKTCKDLMATILW